MADAKLDPSVRPVHQTRDFAAKIISDLIKYGTEGLVVAIAAFLLPKYMGGKSLPPSQIGMIGLVALATFAILDYGSPSIAAGARQGAGFGIGAKLTGFP